MDIVHLTSFDDDDPSTVHAYTDTFMLNGIPSYQPETGMTSRQNGPDKVLGSGRG